MSRREGQHALPRPAAAGAGEIVEVQGGHIVRSIGRKDRHSKVCTSKGPRDRRVRLSAHTAIQFYDVQDRLGYDRPSKAVDWLIRNAKAAIDELDELPPWRPTSNATAAATVPITTAISIHDVRDSGFSSKNAPPSIVSPPPVATYSGYTDGELLLPSLDSNIIADTIKYLFPLSAATAASNYPIDMTPHNSNQTQDLRLSLQSSQDPILFRSHQPPTPTQPLHFGSDQNPRMPQWNLGVGSGEINFRASAQQQHAAQMPHAVPLSQMLAQNTAVIQRGPLQSNAPESLHPWPDPTELSGFGSGAGYWGFRIPMRIHGEEDPGKLPPPSSRP